MIERRRHRRIAVDFWASLVHPLLGTVTCEIENISPSGILLKPDEAMPFFVMMEFDIRIYGEGLDSTMPSFPVQVVRVQGQQIALQFLSVIEEAWFFPIIELAQSRKPSPATKNGFDTLLELPRYS